MKQTKDKVTCVSAGSKWYSVGKTYLVYVDEKKDRHVQGSDGHYDKLSKMVSKFKGVKGGD